MPQQTISVPMLSTIAERVRLGMKAVPHSGLMDKAWKQIAFVYRSWARERFAIFSRGGGDWAPLKEGTLGGRRDVRKAKASVRTAGRAVRAAKVAFWKARAAYRKKPSAARKLRMTKQDARLVKAVATTRERVRKLVDVKRRVGILWDTGTLIAALDPTFSARPGALEQPIENGIRVGYGGPGGHPLGKATVALIAEYHQTGGPNLPARRIIVPPPADVQQRMAAILETALGEIGKAVA